MASCKDHELGYELYCQWMIIVSIEKAPLGFLTQESVQVRFWMIPSHFNAAIQWISPRRLLQMETVVWAECCWPDTCSLSPWCCPDVAVFLWLVFSATWVIRAWYAPTSRKAKHRDSLGPCAHLDQKFDFNQSLYWKHEIQWNPTKSIKKPAGCKKMQKVMNTRNTRWILWRMLKVHTLPASTSSQYKSP